MRKQNKLMKIHCILATRAPFVFAWLFVSLLVSGCGGGNGETYDRREGCVSNFDCGASEYCQLGGRCDELGECVVRPEVCTAEVSPVCSCTGEEFSNACMAAMEGASIESYTACR